MRTAIIAVSALLISAPAFAQQSIATGTLAATAAANDAYDSRGQIEDAANGIGGPPRAGAVDENGNPLILLPDGSVEVEGSAQPTQRSVQDLNAPVASEATVQQVN